MLNKAPRWFVVMAALALLWNLAGLLAVLANLGLSAEQIAALPADQQALHASRPAWSIAGSVVAVVAGTAGCVWLLVRRRWALWAFGLSLAGLVLQDIGLFAIAAKVQAPGAAVVAMQAAVFLIAVALLLVARRAAQRGWLR